LFGQATFLEFKLTGINPDKASFSS